MFESERWGRLATALGLRLTPHHEPFRRRQSFAELERSMRHGAHEPPSTSHWMVGEWPALGRHGEVVVALDVEGVGEETRYRSTRVVARVDPPKHVGILILRKGEATLDGMRVETGDLRFDEAFSTSLVVSAEAPVLALQLDEPTELRAQLEPLLPFDFEVLDGRVDLSLFQHVYDESILRTALDSVARAAVAFARVHFSLDDATTASFASVARAIGLVSAPDRHRLSGSIANLPTVLAIEARPEAIVTTLECLFPRTIGLDLRVAKQRSMQFIANLFGSPDIVVGDRAFDAAFVVRGLAARDHLVRDFFALRPALRRGLVAIARDARDFVMDDRRLFVRWTKPITDAAELRAICEAVDLVGRDVVTTVDRPYR